MYWYIGYKLILERFIVIIIIYMYLSVLVDNGILIVDA